MSTRRWYVVISVALSCTMVSAAHAQLRGRSFDRFEQDSETARGLWGEVAVESVTDDEDGESANQISVVPRIAYGWENAEIGLSIPYERLSIDDAGPFGNSETEDGIGDMSFYGKGVYRSQWVDAGLGLQITVPTGDEDRGLGAGEAGFLPFGTAAVHLGPVDVRGHIGYLAYTDHRSSFFGLDFPLNQLVYGGGIFGGIGDYVALRAEFIGVQPDTPGTVDLVNFEPGLDVRIPAGPVDVLIRPTGVVGLTSAAVDWGVGGGIAVLWKP